MFVIYDVTRLLRLESMRRDFVANVSHELKTPVTSIKGFAETLLDGSEHEPEVVKRFIEKISRQASRLQRLIEDVLTLSGMEHAAERGEIELEPNLVAGVLQSAARSCRETAENLETRIEVQCEPELKAHLNVPLLEQAVVNLIDNALKYGDPKAVVLVTGDRAEEGCVIRVKDQGAGIDGQYHDRLFERFYRVDKGRSRSLGGTGLGLAIVKHVAIAHRGRVTVESEPGKGSVFSIILP